MRGTNPEAPRVWIRHQFKPGGQDIEMEQEYLARRRLWAVLDPILRSAECVPFVQHILENDIE
jgi:hypothetical protein